MSITETQLTQIALNIRDQGQRLNAGVGILADGIVYAAPIPTELTRLGTIYKEQVIDFSSTHLSIAAIDFISNMGYANTLTQKLNDMLTNPLLNTYDENVKGLILATTHALADNYDTLSGGKPRPNELKVEVVKEQLAMQKSQFEQFVGRIGMQNPELANQMKEIVPTKMFNDVADVIKGTNVLEQGYKPTFSNNQYGR